MFFRRMVWIFYFVRGSFVSIRTVSLSSDAVKVLRVFLCLISIFIFWF